MASIKKVLNRANIIALWVFIPLCLALISVYVYEKTQTVSDYVKYYYVLPTKYNFNEGDVIQYYSINESHKETPYIKWEETTRCNTNGQGFGHHASTSSEAYDFFLDRKISGSIKALAKTLTDANDDYIYDETTRGLDQNIEAQLRTYARKNQLIAPWTLDIVPNPIAGSVCLTRHTVNVTTPILGLVLKESFTSAPFTYGVQELVTRSSDAQ